MALVNPGGSASRVPPAPAEHVAALKDVVREQLGIATDTSVLIQQLACAEPGCPPVETVVAVLGPDRRSWKFGVATAQITHAHLRATLRDNPEGRKHDDQH